MELIIVVFVLWGIGVLLFGGKRKDAAAQVPESRLPESILEREFADFREKMAEGGLQNEMSSSLILKGDEHLIFELQGIQFAEERVKRTRGVGQGISIRVMKGVSYRLSTFSAAPERVVEPLDEGSLTLTNRRFSFRGTTRSIEFPLSKLSAIEAFDSGISISRAGKTKIEYFLGLQAFSASWLVTPEEGEDFEAETLNYVFDGFECREVVMMLVSKLGDSVDPTPSDP